MIVSMVIDSRKYSFVHIVAFMDFCAVTPKSITIKHSLSHSLSSLFSPYLSLLSLQSLSTSLSLQPKNSLILPQCCEQHSLVLSTQTYYFHGVLGDGAGAEGGNDDGDSNDRDDGAIELSALAHVIIAHVIINQQ